jgi:SAM-dependent methyltransferase
VTESSWDRLDSWWREEVERDPEYRHEVWPLLIDLLNPEPDHRYLDLGCGSGAVMAALVDRGSRVVGTDISHLLLEEAAWHGPVVRARLPDLGWVAPASFDGACLSLVVEHVEDEADLFAQAAAAVRPDGVLAAVLNHPVWTAPGSSPMLDDDGEVLWRPGRYFSRGFSDELAGGESVRFHHRTMADLLNAAADAGWMLERMEERGPSQSEANEDPLLAKQRHFPRLLGVRWRRR